MDFPIQVRPPMPNSSVHVYDITMLFVTLESVDSNLIDKVLPEIYSSPSYASGVLYGLVVAGLVNVTVSESGTEEFSLTSAGKDKMYELLDEILCDKTLAPLWTRR